MERTLLAWILGANVAIALMMLYFLVTLVQVQSALADAMEAWQSIW